MKLIRLLLATSLLFLIYGCVATGFGRTAIEKEGEESFVIESCGAGAVQPSIPQIGLTKDETVEFNEEMMLLCEKYEKSNNKDAGLDDVE